MLTLEIHSSGSMDTLRLVLGANRLKDFPLPMLDVKVEVWNLGNVDEVGTDEVVDQKISVPG